MEEDWKPFEVRETEEGTTLYLRGTEESRVKVEADKVAKILEAIKRGWNVDIQYAIIDGSIDIRDTELGRDESGRRIITGEIRIANSEINGEAYFTGASLNGEAHFWGASFKEVAYFDGASFIEDSSFEGTSFNYDPDLRITGHDKLSPDSLASIGLAYRKSMLSGASYFFEKSGHGYWADGKFSQASEAFRDAKVDYEKEGKYDEAGVMYVWEKDSTRRQLRPQILSKRDRSARSVIKFLWLSVWKVTCNYGEAPLRFIGWAAFIILFFALIYSPLFNWWPPRSWESWALIEFKEYPYAEGNSFLTTLYFSVVTFATLGFGDITPMNNFGKVVVVIEVLSGYVMFGILITLVARKMTRS